MELIDKTALVAEIEKCYNVCLKRVKITDSDYWNAKVDAYRNVLTILEDTLEVKEVKEEPVSNDLEEAAHSYVDTTIEWFDSEGNPCCYPAFIAGAQWQKEQLIEKACEWLKENKDHPFIECEDPCLSGYLTDEFIEDFKKAMENKLWNNC